MKIIFFLFVAGLAACSQHNNAVVSSNELTWIDLTHPYDSTTLYWPNNIKGFEHITEAEGITASGYYYSSYSICTPEHGGTHLDAPIHFAENKLTEYPTIPSFFLEQAMGSSTLTGKNILVLQKPALKLYPNYIFPAFPRKLRNGWLKKEISKHWDWTPQVWITANQKHLKPIGFYWAAINPVLKILPI